VPEYKDACASISRIRLKGCPVERFWERPIGMEQEKVCGAKGRRRTRSPAEFIIKDINELLGRHVTGVPQGSDHVVSTGPDEGPARSHQALAGI
jgi:hypothetical protein